MEILLKYLIGTLAIVFTFGLAVFVHEFGHMFFALIRGVGVEAFAIGMGPKITEWRWRGIEFSLRWLPVGGFVKLKGMVAEEIEEEPPAQAEAQPEAEAGDGQDAAEQAPVASEAPGGAEGEDKTLSESSYDDLLALRNKGLGTKLLVFGGGVFMNLVAAMVAMALVMYLGQRVYLHPVIVEVVKDPSAAQQIQTGREVSMLTEAGLKAGDQVLAVNGADTPYFDNFVKNVGELSGRANRSVIRLYADFALFLFRTDSASEQTPMPELELTVLRDGAELQLALPRWSQEEFDTFQIELDGSLKREPIVGELFLKYPADRAGIERGDRITAINGRPIQSFREMQKVIWDSPAETIVVEVERGGQRLSLEMTPRADWEDKKRGQIGILNGSTHTGVKRVANPLRAIALAPLQTIEHFLSLARLNVRFFSKASVTDVRDNLGGPVAIAVMITRATERGFVGSLEFFVTLNLLLMFFNLLPLPVLDGGFILLSFIEAIIRRPVPPKILGPIYMVFVIFFITLMSTITGLDIWNYFIK